MASGVPSWHHTYGRFQAELASQESALVPFVTALPPIKAIESFTYENGKFTLIFKEKNPYCRGEHAGDFAKKVKKTSFCFQQTFSGSFSKEKRTLTLEGLSVSYSMFSAKIISLTAVADWGLNIGVKVGPFTRNEVMNYDTTSDFQLKWQPEVPN